MKKCVEKGFNFGGIFIFKGFDEKGRRIWKYRTNEFSYLKLKEGTEKLFQQAKELQAIVKEFGFENIDISFSIELVHGIWDFKNRF